MKIIVHEANGLQIGQRWEDGYINATQMCQAHHKKWHEYLRLPTTQEYLNGLAKDLGMLVILNNPKRENPSSALVLAFKGGNSQQGTWVHPEVAIDLAAWISVEFRILVNRWVREWMVTGRNPLSPKPAATPTDLQAELDELERLIISIRSQARTLHAGAHQPVDEILLKSLHHLTHQQLGLIASAIGQVQMLKQVSEFGVSSSELGVSSAASPSFGAELEGNNAEFRSGLAALKPPGDSQLQEDWPASPREIDSRNQSGVLSREAAVRLTVDLPETMHRKLSILSAKTGRTKADIVRMLLEETLKDVEG